MRDGPFNNLFKSFEQQNGPISGGSFDNSRLFQHWFETEFFEEIMANSVMLEEDSEEIRHLEEFPGQFSELGKEKCEILSNYFNDCGFSRG